MKTIYFLYRYSIRASLFCNFIASDEESNKLSYSNLNLLQVLNLQINKNCDIGSNLQIAGKGKFKNWQ